jgi:hypothetical protein
MRYEVRQEDENWLVWDTTLDHCVMKSVVGAVDGLRSAMASNYTPPKLKTKPAMFGTQEEAQQCADTLNDFVA